VKVFEHHSKRTVFLQLIGMEIYVFLFEMLDYSSIVLGVVHEILIILLVSVFVQNCSSSATSVMLLIISA